jgi:hypothetical protein
VAYLQNGQHPPVVDVTCVAAAAVTPNSATRPANTPKSLLFIVCLLFGSEDPWMEGTA